VFLWAALPFVAGQLALAVALETDLFLRDPEDGSRLALFSKWCGTRTDVKLALGTSRTANGLCTDDLFDQGQPFLFNYGITGSDLPEQALRLRRLLASGIRPQAVYLEILPAHLAQPTCRLEDRAGRLGWSDLVSLPSLKLSLRRLGGGWLKARALPCFTSRAVLLSRWLPWLLPEESRMERYWEGVSAGGWRVYGRECVSAAEYRRGLEHARRRFEHLLHDFRVHPVPDRAVRDMLGLCRDERIPVVVYLMPEATAVREWYTAEGEEILHKYLRGITREYGVRVIDARDWLADDAFADGHHLLPGGAAAFSARFVQELRRSGGHG
jgi:hypothetical protein